MNPSGTMGVFKSIPIGTPNLNKANPQKLLNACVFSMHFEVVLSKIGTIVFWEQKKETVFCSCLEEKDDKHTVGWEF